ncbi:protein of unknown function, might related with Alkyl sulfatase [Shewanella benthica]|uniref:Uncharacterized protein n=1 Tax=Shewanella benthica TaxID=43661 RepID=A0A330LYM5_9GAMM|nr:hypothetical protein [Shewanella benthica]SQH75021.1 protein of unknown function, might related with Alkyl sulfatase [Shewanella benthica]
MLNNHNKMDCGQRLFLKQLAKHISKQSLKQGFTPATSYTLEANSALPAQLPFEDKQDFIDANPGGTLNCRT